MSEILVALLAGAVLGVVATRLLWPRTVVERPRVVRGWRCSVNAIRPRRPKMLSPRRNASSPPLVVSCKGTAMKRPPLPPLPPPSRIYLEGYGFLPPRDRSLVKKCIQLINDDRRRFG